MKRLCSVLLLVLLTLASIAPVLADEPNVYQMTLTDADNMTGEFAAWRGSFAVAGAEPDTVFVVTRPNGDIEMFCVLNDQPTDSIRKEEGRTERPRSVPLYTLARGLRSSTLLARQQE